MSLTKVEYAKLVIASAGTLVNLFLLILIVGYRRPRTFERILFFIALATFLFYGGLLLFMNAAIYYTDASAMTSAMAISEFLMACGLSVFPGLLIHAHLSFGQSEGYWQRKRWHTAAMATGYLIAVPFLIAFAYLLQMRSRRLEVIANSAVWYITIWAVGSAAALLLCAGFEWVFASKGKRHVAKSPSVSRGKHLYQFLAACFLVLGLTLLALVFAAQSLGTTTDLLTLVLFTTGVLPGAGLVYAIVRFNFLGISAQRNLVYSVSAAFLALLYLGVVRRISVWLEPVLPPEATSAILLFVLVGFFEPLQRIASRLLRKSFQEQVDRVQKLGSELQREAQLGEMAPLLRFAEDRIREEFGLEQVQIQLQDGDEASPQQPEIERRPSWAGQPVTFPIGKAAKKREPGTQIGELLAVPIGSVISGETFAALEFLAEQLPAVIGLCRAIDQKLKLERELAERERMALVGQMTASISHNLKNPLGSMKTMLQVQLENKDLPHAARQDLAMVLGELDRLSNKLTQLLRYARPTVRAGAAPQCVEAGAVAEQAVALLRHEAERRGGRLDLHDESDGAEVRGSEEALADIFSNLVINAIEAMPENGSISVRLMREGSKLQIEVTDDGPGFSPENRERLFQPFFTTKPSGTGLGLAIVQRRATEAGGTVACESPIANGRGARFVVKLPLRLPLEQEG